MRRARREARDQGADPRDGGGARRDGGATRDNGMMPLDADRLFHLRSPKRAATARWRSSCRRSGTSAPGRSSCASSTTSTRPSSGRSRSREHREIVAPSRARRRGARARRCAATWTMPPSASAQRAGAEPRGNEMTEQGPSRARKSTSSTRRASSTSHDEPIDLSHLPLRGLDRVRDLLGAGAIVIFYQFFTRYALNDSASWTEEIARYLLICTVFVGAAINVRKNNHIQVDFFYRFLPRVGDRVDVDVRRRRCASLFLGYCVWLTYRAHAARSAASAWRSSTGRSASSYGVRASRASCS